WSPARAQVIRWVTDGPQWSPWLVAGSLQPFRRDTLSRCPAKSTVLPVPRRSPASTITSESMPESPQLTPAPSTGRQLNWKVPPRTRSVQVPAGPLPGSPPAAATWSWVSWWRYTPSGGAEVDAGTWSGDWLSATPWARLAGTAGASGAGGGGG